MGAAGAGMTDSSTGRPAWPEHWRLVSVNDILDPRCPSGLASCVGTKSMIMKSAEKGIARYESRSFANFLTLPDDV